MEFFEFLHHLLEGTSLAIQQHVDSLERQQKHDDAPEPPHADALQPYRQMPYDQPP